MSIHIIKNEIQQKYLYLFSELAYHSAVIGYYTHLKQTPTNGINPIPSVGYNTIIQALELLQCILTQFPIGAHIHNNMLQLLIQLSSIGVPQQELMSPGQTSRHQQLRAYHSECNIIATTALNTLTEIMGLKYLPGSGPTGSTGAGMGVDPSVQILTQLLSQVLQVIRYYHGAYISITSSITNKLHIEVYSGEWEESSSVQSLLNFITAFIQNHFERCLHSVMLYSGSNSNNNNGSTAVMISDLCVQLVEACTLFTECCHTPVMLTKFAIMWKCLIDTLYTYSEGSAVMVIYAHAPQLQYKWYNVIKHLLQFSLCQYNPALAEVRYSAGI